LCTGSPACLDDAVRRRGFDRAFGTTIGAADLQQLCAQLGEASERRKPDVRG
jgi:hypothetical protein